LLQIERMKLDCSSNFMGLAACLLLVSCNVRPSNDLAIAHEIEIQVTKRVPEMNLKHQARFYAHSKAGRIVAVYLYGTDTDTAIVGTPGTSVWVTEENLPQVMDGGCSVVHIVFDTKSQKIDELHCNGEA
jgi:hypothetical protein